MTFDSEALKKWLMNMAALIMQNAEPDPQHFSSFLQQPDLALELITLLDEIEDDSEPGQAYYSACVFALDICVAQLQTAQESGNKLATKTLNQVMLQIAEVINKGHHALGFWLPILNAFYEVHVDLIPELKQAYLNLAGQIEELTPEEEVDHLNAIREMIEELSDLSVFDIAENFFAQSYAMPPDFFVDLLFDLYSIEEGHDIALLSLLHPKKEVREVAIATCNQIMKTITLTSVSLSRLQAIKNWYPPSYRNQFDHWIKIQRKNGVVFHTEQSSPLISIKASEVDGSGAQGIFIHVKKRGKDYLCGLLFKYDYGIKDAWITPAIQADDIPKYYHEAFDDSVTLREIDTSYLLMMVGHFLALMVQREEMPDLHLLEIQELLGLHFLPHFIDVSHVIEQLSVQITPFTPEALQSSLKRSKSWPKNKRFTESWYIENSHIDKLVNRCCTIIEGVKVCTMEDAMNAVFAQELEPQRDKWVFHFLWIALWLKSKARKNEKMWQDSLFIAYAIHSDIPLKDIPIMKEICLQTVINSIETMNERRTHLNKE
ncbi:exonuclease SbcCD subunit D C-terminal domain-containing protein [Legionella jamestowniensis]|uniref:YecA family protein n=1 Tax=Legionella jamestowniensis TaxID=455 RepID=A0A0W0UI67_9GAMM|nr:exonuclease SbcCD subunit D C-terminal domain-containing protein [Legionella jamestowniensis]KTD07560.1 hypothetical protein Ljam_1755 [Legionella jamestowniensis]OCH97672.1 hypothetical protein A8135_02205 [Legionella jamestowniensis]SFM01761.1 hypothetical protein SAMN02746073_3085 [Legionella jamestowniensis DSM 19215]